MSATAPQPAPRPRVGLMGLGLVGTALARRLLAAGYPCCGTDVRATARAQFAALGGSACADATSVAAQSDVLITALMTTEQVVQVLTAAGLLGAGGSRAAPTRAVIDCSTGDPAQVQALGDRLSSAQIDLIEAPLSGSSQQIERGEATLLLAGDGTARARWVHVLKVLSPKQIQLGALGSASKAKLATNLVLGLNRAALAEGFAFAESVGIDRAQFLELVLATPARSEAAVVKGPRMVAQHFADAQSRIGQHLKDLRLMLQTAQTAGQPLPLTQTHAALLAQAVAAGDGELDNAAIVQQLCRLRTAPASPTLPDA